MKNKRDGFSMIEVMVGMLVLTFLVLTTDAYMVSLIKTNTSAKEISQATFIGNTGMEKLKGRRLPNSPMDAIRLIINTVAIGTWSLSAI